MASIEIYYLGYLFVDVVKLFTIAFHYDVLRSLRLKCSLNCAAFLDIQPLYSIKKTKSIILVNICP